jgi:hypothetical protein
VRGSYLTVPALRLALRPYIALLLLLCLVRTLLPEAWVLALHRHEHTTEEPAFTKSRPILRGKTLLTTKHTHCQTEQFYNVPFQVAPPVAVPLPRLLLRYQRVAWPASSLADYC